MQHLIIFTAGIILGAVILLIAFKISGRIRKPIGDLRVDRSDPRDAPLLFLELNKDTNVHTIISKKFVIFRVKLENFLPHE